MKLIYTVLIAGLSLPLLADSPPSYLGITKATVLTSLTTRGNLSVVTGTPENCVRSEATGLIVYRCDLKNATASYNDEKGNFSVTFSNLIAMYKTYHGQLYREFNFQGEWTEKGPIALNSKVQITVVQNADTPESVKGTFSLSTYNLDYPFQGSVAKE
jgi:hypothetical protein